MVDHAQAGRLTETGRGRLGARRRGRHAAGAEARLRGVNGELMRLPTAKGRIGAGARAGEHPAAGVGVVEPVGPGDRGHRGGVGHRERGSDRRAGDHLRREAAEAGGHPGRQLVVGHDRQVVGDLGEAGEHGAGLAGGGARQEALERRRGAGGDRPVERVGAGVAEGPVGVGNDVEPAAVEEGGGDELEVEAVVHSAGDLIGIGHARGGRLGVRVFEARAVAPVADAVDRVEGLAGAGCGERLEGRLGSGVEVEVAGVDHRGRAAEGGGVRPIGLGLEVAAIGARGVVDRLEVAVVDEEVGRGVIANRPELIAEGLAGLAGEGHPADGVFIEQADGGRVVDGQRPAAAVGVAVELGGPVGGATGDRVEQIGVGLAGRARAKALLEQEDVEIAGEARLGLVVEGLEDGGHA